MTTDSVTEPPSADEHTGQRRVWYASYGSNLLEARFLCYLAGGPIPGATTGRVQAGARDPSPPRHQRPMAIEHTLYFALASKQWGNGGVAFLDGDERPETPTLGRVWDISVGQLEDVFAQENGATSPPSIDLDDLERSGQLDLLPSNYGRLLWLGTSEDQPVVTFTSSQRLAGNPADESYLSVIAAGLRESWALSPSEVDNYLAALPQGARLAE